MKHWEYLKYLLKHKWYVAIECFKRGLYLHGITHDLSKFRSSEWFPYVEYFYGDFGINNKCPAKWITQKCFEVQRAFDIAWLKHQHRNRHHWQHWLLLGDEGEIKPIHIPFNILMQMACDWIGASKATRGKSASPAEWYGKVKKETILTFENRVIFERLINFK